MRIRTALFVLGASLTSCALSVSFDEFNTRTWVVEGSVSGLGEETVALRLNGERFEVGNGPFTSRRIADGSRYTLSIEAQPRSGRCSIAGGEGVVSGGNVTGVVVRCAQTYGVRGVVAGLDEGAVQLKLEKRIGAVSLPLAVLTVGNGPFVFSGAQARLANGDHFTVAVASQPLARQCVVANGRGSISGGDATNVLVSCAAQNRFLTALSVEPCSPDDADPTAPCTSNGTPAMLMPAFAPETMAYTFTALTNCSRYKLCLSVVPVAGDFATRIRVNGLSLVNGKADVVISPASGSQSIDVAVTAPDGTEHHYIVAVNVLQP